MAEIMLFHAALGLRHGVIDGANRLRDVGHIVYTPDYFDGEVFSDLAEGERKSDALGMEEMAKRVRTAVAVRQPRLVFAGFGLGAGLAELLAGTQPEAQGVLLIHGAIPVEEAAPTGWPPGVPVQVHHAVEDAWTDGGAVAALQASVAAAGAFFEAHAYPGSGRVLTDPDLPGYDDASAEVMWERILDFLKRVDRRSF